MSYPETYLLDLSTILNKMAASNFDLISKGHKGVGMSKAAKKRVTTLDC